MNTLNIWSDIPGQWYKASTKSDAIEKAEKEAKAGHKTLVEQVNSVNDLLRLFTRLANESDVWHTLNFYTHGSGGAIALGSNHLDLSSLERFENQDLSRIFAANCVITFDGCNVAEGAQGEFFLVEVGDVFLSVNGGKVRGSTGAGFGYWGGSDSSVHPFGDWITATVGPGGTIRFDKLNHLHPDRINERIAEYSRRIVFIENEMNEEDGFLPGEKQEIQKCLGQARAWGVSRWSARFQSCLWLDKAESKLRVIETRRIVRKGVGR